MRVVVVNKVVVVINFLAVHIGFSYWSITVQLTLFEVTVTVAVVVIDHVVVIVVSVVVVIVIAKLNSNFKFNFSLHHVSNKRNIDCNLIECMNLDAT